MNIPFFSDIDIKGNRILNVGTPNDDNDVANKIYIDEAISTLENTLRGEISVETTRIDTDISGLSDRVSTIENGLDTKINSAILDNVVDNMVTADATKSLSANQGVEIKSLIDDIRNSLRFNNYLDTPVVIGSYFGKDLNRIVLTGTITTKPASKKVNIESANNIFEPFYSYEIIKTYGYFIPCYEETLPNVNKTYQLIGAPFVEGMLDTNVYLGETYIENDVINTSIEFGQDLYDLLEETTLPNYYHMLSLNYIIVIEYTSERNIL